MTTTPPPIPARGGGNTKPEVSVVVTPGATTASSVSFTVAPQNADKCAYVCLKNVEGIELPDAVSVMAEGRQLEKVETQLVEVKELEAEAEYVVLAAASAGENAPVLSEPITLTTEKVNQGTTMEVTLAEGERTESTLSFTVTTANAAECRYRYFKKTEDFVLPDKYDIFATGDKVETSSPQEILLENLDDDTTYVIVAVVEAADSYDKEMSEPLEMTTLKRDKPENVDQQHFTEGELQVYSGGNNFYVKLTNDAYTVVLDLYDDYAKEKAPVIPAHEYSYLKGSHSNEPWVMASTSSVTAVSGAAFEIEKGSVNVGFADGAYTIVGSLISQDNKQLDIDYKGSLAFPVKLNSGKIEKSEKGYLAAFTGENLYGLNLEFITDKIAAGTYSFDNGTLGGNSALICGTTEYAVKAGSVELSLPSETNYVIKGELTTAEGYPLSLDVSIYGVTQPEEPGDAIVFTSISQAYAEADATGWAINYSVEFENDEWQAAFEFCNDGGTGSQIPAYKYLYSSYVESGTGCVTQYRIVNKKTSETLTLDEGSVTVAYADGVGIRDCTNTSSFPTSNRNGVTGGIAGQVLNAQIEDCLNKALVFADGTGDAVTVKAGGIVGDLGENSAVRGSKHYGVVYPKIYGSTAKPEYKVLTSGGIAGVSVKGTVIENCGFGGQLKGADDAHTFEMKLENICSDTNFTGSGNSLWDGK